MVDMWFEGSSSTQQRARKRVRRARGFTLVELLIALSVFMVVIASCFACLQLGNQLVDNARHYTRASQVMQSEIERIRSMAWGTLTTLPADETTLDIPAQFDQEVYRRYTLTRSITGSDDMRTITLRVSWSDVRGKDHTREYVTMYVKGGLYDYIQ